MAAPSSSAAAAPKSILFLGATGGTGLAALKLALSAGYTCVALCRTPAKLETLLGIGSDSKPAPENLHIVSGNAHNEDDVRAALIDPMSKSSGQRRIVDVVVSTIGSAVVLNLSTGGMVDPTVCEVGARTLVSAVTALNAEGIPGKPRVVAMSTTGTSDFGRDVPLALLPVYKTLIDKPHRDKKAMEKILEHSADKVAWTVVRASLLYDRSDDASDKKKSKVVRVGMEDPVTGVETREIGYFISRQEVGKWIFETIIQPEDLGQSWVGKIATVTH